MNKKNMKKDVLKLALPAVGEMILYMMIWILDTVMVGQYAGSVGISSVSLSSEILYTFSDIFISIGIAIGICSLVARNYGSNDIERAEQFASLGLFIGTIIAFIISILCFIFAKEILSIAGAKNEIMKYGIIYMKLAAISLFFSMVTSLLNSILRAYGNTTIPLLISILVNIVNLSLDWLLIFGIAIFPELGIAGAGYATLCADFCGFIFAALYLFNKSKIKIRFKYIKKLNIFRIKELIHLSIPSSMQQSALSISRLLSIFMVVHMGKISFTANQIAGTIETLSFMPGWGFGVAATTLAGRKFGEKNFKEAKQYANLCVLFGTILMSMCGLLFLIFPSPLVKLFIKDNEVQVIHLAILCVMIASIEQPFMAISMIYGGALKGIGDTKTPFIISFISSWLIRIPIMYYIIYVLKLEITYVWLATAVQWSFDGLMVMFLFKKKFKKQLKKQLQNNFSVDK